MEDAVVGIVDIVGSTQISYSVDLTADFLLKQEFLSEAARLARKHDIIILNHTGDGFLFLANYGSKREWRTNLVGFYGALTARFDELLTSTRLDSGRALDSGLRFGISRGNVILGCLGSSPATFTAVGRDVNLAARLAAAAAKNEIVFNVSVWEEVAGEFHAGPQVTRQYEFKGCAGMINAVHVSRERINPSRPEFEVKSA
jgi:class 3 adenylate cyclase